MSNETELTVGEICVGIEIEGLARLSFTWNEAGKLRINSLIEATKQGNKDPVKEFANTFKRTPLIRSNSFRSWTAGQATDSANRGVYAVPEEEKNKLEEYGIDNP